MTETGAPQPAEVPAPTARKPAKKAPKKATASKPVPKLRAGDVVTSLRRHYNAERDGLGPEWAALEEFSLAPGAGYQRIDLFVVRAWSGRPKGHERHAIEVKVSRSDLRSELANLGKSAPFDEVSHRFYLATPAGLVKDTDPVPEHWGRYEIQAHGGCRKVKEAVRRPDPDPLPERALVEAFRRAARAEARVRGAGDSDPAALAARLNAELTAAQRARHTAQAAAYRSQEKLRTLLREISAAGGWACVCGAPMKRGRWANEHADGTRCERSRYGSAEPDLTSLARRLGILDEDSPLEEEVWNL